jgi:hypothetical protein
MMAAITDHVSGVRFPKRAVPPTEIASAVNSTGTGIKKRMASSNQIVAGKEHVAEAT